MDWVTYNKAKELEKNMDLLNNLAENKLDIKYENPIYPLYSFLSQRLDFKEYIKKVYAELNDEFHNLGDSFGKILNDDEIENLADEFYAKRSVEYEHMGRPDIMAAFIAGYNKATEL